MRMLWHYVRFLYFYEIALTCSNSQFIYSLCIHSLYLLYIFCPYLLYIILPIFIIYYIAYIYYTLLCLYLLYIVLPIFIIYYFAYILLKSCSLQSRYYSTNFSTQALLISTHQIINEKLLAGCCVLHASQKGPEY